MRRPALRASAADELPKKCAKMLSRIMPAIRLSRIPDATMPAAPPGGRNAASDWDCSSPATGLVTDSAKGERSIAARSLRLEHQCRILRKPVGLAPVRDRGEN